MFKLTGWLSDDRMLFLEMGQLADHASGAAMLLQDMVQPASVATGGAKGITEQRSAASNLARSLLHRLGETFITPLEREDIHNIIIELNRTSEIVTRAVQWLTSLGLSSFDQELVEQIFLLRHATDVLAKLIRRLQERSLHQIMPLLDNLREIDQQAELLRRAMLRKLFSDKSDLLEVMKLHQAQELLDMGFSCCNRLSNVAQRALLKAS